MSDSKNFLTLDDLYSALSDRKRSFHFDATKNGTPLLVHSFGNLSYESDNAGNGLTEVEFVAANTGANLNRSYIDYDVMKDKLMPTFKNRPILGYIHEVDGEPNFYTHNMHLDPDTDEIVYDEITVGIIPESNNATLEYNEQDDNYVLKITGYLFDEYTKAVEILNREKQCAASVEIAVSKMSYDAKAKLLNIEDGYFAGITILGKTDDGTPVQPGMKDANVKLKDFENASTEFFANAPDQDILVKMLTELRNAIDNLNLKGKEVEKSMEFEKNENNEIFEEKVILEESKEEEKEDGTESEVEEVKEMESAEVNEGAEESEGEDKDESSDDQNFESRVFSNGVASYELSHEDIRFALYQLLDAVGDEDNEWYFIEEVYDDHFVYTNWLGDKIFGQDYSRENDNISFSGDRYVLYRELLTQGEKDALDAMRKNYSEIETELNSYKEKELASLRDQVISEEAYADFMAEPEFVEIKEKISEYSVEDLRTACDLAFAKCIKRIGSFERHNNEEQNAPSAAQFAFGAFDHESDFLKNLLNK